MTTMTAKLVLETGQFVGGAKLAGNAVAQLNSGLKGLEGQIRPTATQLQNMQAAAKKQEGVAAAVRSFDQLAKGLGLTGKQAMAMGRQLGAACVTNVWIPDGYKDVTIDRKGPRELLARSLDEMFAEPIDPAQNLDAVEGKAEAGKEDVRFSLQKRIEALDKEIDVRVYRLYGLTEEEIKIVEKKE